MCTVEISYLVILKVHILYLGHRQANGVYNRDVIMTKV